MSDDAETLFERGCALRDEERLEDARVAFLECLHATPEDDGRLRAGARQAVALRPKSELASLQFFIWSVQLGRVKEAYEEAIRFLQLRSSDEYRTMLIPPCAEEQDPEIARLAETTRELLGRFE